MGIEQALADAKPNEELLNRITRLVAQQPLSEEELHAQLISFIKGSGSYDLSTEKIEELLQHGTKAK